MKRITKSLITLALSASFIVGCSLDTSEDNQVTLELFNNKPENIKTYEKIIEDFEKENPDINIELETPPEATTVLRTKLTRNTVPDLMSISGEAIYGEMAREGMLYDFSNSDMLENVQASYLDMLARLVGTDAEGTYGIPYATNAVSVIYNKDKLTELGLSIPTTWDEFLSVLEVTKKAGETPLYFTLQDSWTGMPLWNALASNLVSPDFAERKSANKASFVEAYDEVAEKALTITGFGQKDIMAVGYDDGNRKFASGEGVFYIQGSWVIPELLRINPDLSLGTFALPVQNDPEKNKLISGVDVALAISESTEHKEEALTFVKFMVSEEISKRYIDEQKAFSAITGVYQEDPVFEGIRKNFEDGTISSFVDHYYPNGLGHEALVQEFYIDKDKQKSLEKLDNEWDKVIDR